MRALAVAALLMMTAACASPTPTTRPTNSPPPTQPSATARAVASVSELEIGKMAVVVAGELHQVADPNRPRDLAYQSPQHAGERSLRTLGESAHVMVVGGPTNPNGDIYWQVADNAFPGCCAPFGWVRDSQSSGDPAVQLLDATCPDPAVAMDGNQLLGLGLMEAASCFRDLGFELRGDVRCDQPSVDSFLSITGPDWAHDQTLCILDNAVALYGEPVTSLLEPGQTGFEGVVDLRARFNEPTSSDCRWGPGSFMPIPIDDAPINTAQFACRMSVYVTSATAAS